MPTYDFQCDKCRKRFAVKESIAAHGRKRSVCPKCKSTQVSRVFAPFYAKTVKKS